MGSIDVMFLKNVEKAVMMCTILCTLTTHDVISVHYSVVSTHPLAIPLIGYNYKLIAETLRQ